VFLSSGT